MAIQIMVDSASDYEPEEVKAKNLICVSLSVSFGAEEYLDGVTISKGEFFQKLATDSNFPKTSQPSPALFAEYFEHAKENGDTVIAILLSGALSGTVQSAMLAKEMVEYDKIYIIDSRLVTSGIRILTEYALQLIEQGTDAQTIVEKLEQLKKRVRIYAGIDTLENLCRGGRLSKSAADIGKLVKLKPIVTMNEEGCVEIAGKHLGLSRTFKQLAALVQEEGVDETFPVTFLFAESSENCDKMIQVMEKAGIPCKAPNKVGIGAAIGTHIGSGAYGIVYIKK